MHTLHSPKGNNVSMFLLFHWCFLFGQGLWAPKISHTIYLPFLFFVHIIWTLNLFWEDLKWPNNFFCPSPVLLFMEVFDLHPKINLLPVFKALCHHSPSNFRLSRGKIKKNSSFDIHNYRVISYCLCTLRFSKNYSFSSGWITWVFEWITDQYFVFWAEQRWGLGYCNPKVVGSNPLRSKFSDFNQFRYILISA